MNTSILQVLSVAANSVKSLLVFIIIPIKRKPASNAWQQPFHPVTRSLQHARPKFKHPPASPAGPMRQLQGRAMQIPVFGLHVPVFNEHGSHLVIMLQPCKQIVSRVFCATDRNGCIVCCILCRHLGCTSIARRMDIFH